MRGFDHSHVLLRSRRVRTFQNQTSSDIVSKILEEAGFRADCDSSGEPHEFVQQNNETDWDFIWRLADRVGFEFTMEDQIGHVPQADARGRDRARVAHRRCARSTPASRRSSRSGGDAAGPGPEDQAGDRRDGVDLGPDRADRRRPRDGRRRVRRRLDAHRHRAGQEPGRGDRRSPRRCSTGSPTATSPPRACATATRRSRRARRSACQASARSSAAPTGWRQATHVLRGGSTYETHFANSPAHTLLGAVGSDRSGGAAELRQPARARDRHQQQRPREPGARAGPLPGAGRPMPRGHGRGSRRRAPATSGAC